MNCFIILPCPTGDHDKVDTETVEVLDISEGDRGQDMLTYKCPACTGQHQSTVYRGRPY